MSSQTQLEACAGKVGTNGGSGVCLSTYIIVIGFGCVEGQGHGLDLGKGARRCRFGK